MLFLNIIHIFLDVYVYYAYSIRMKNKRIAYKRIAVGLVKQVYRDLRYSFSPASLNVMLINMKCKNDNGVTYEPYPVSDRKRFTKEVCLVLKECLPNYKNLIIDSIRPSIKFYGSGIIFRIQVNHLVE